MAKHKGRAYIAEGRSQDDTNSDEEPVQSNYAYALMANTIEESQISLDTFVMTCLMLITKGYK